jgi:hypothetical protein
MSGKKLSLRAKRINLFFGGTGILPVIKRQAIPRSARGGRTVKLAFPRNAGFHSTQ